MSCARVIQLSATVAAVGTAVFVMSGQAGAAPESDSRGYLDSTARCTAPATAVIFGSTASSRVAICEQSDGSYQYRGVRVRDGARLILPATRSGSGYVATRDGLSYTVTPDALVISDGEEVLRDEPLLDVHQPGGVSSSSTGSTTTGSTTTTRPTTTMTVTVTPTSTSPLPPPLPAEVGGS